MYNKKVENNIKNQKILTVVVLDDKNVPTEGANVSISPSDDSGLTNSAGEIRFKLGNDSRYEITATYGTKTVTVPYYIVKDGATRIVINPTYVRSIEKKLHPYTLENIDPALISYAGIGLGVGILLVIIWKIFKRKRRK